MSESGGMRFPRVTKAKGEKIETNKQKLSKQGTRCVSGGDDGADHDAERHVGKY